jgi:hypothetical protein
MDEENNFESMNTNSDSGDSWEWEDEYVVVSEHYEVVGPESQAFLSQSEIVFVDETTGDIEAQKYQLKDPATSTPNFVRVSREETGHLRPPFATTTLESIIDLFLDQFFAQIMLKSTFQRKIRNNIRKNEKNNRGRPPKNSNNTDRNRKYYLQRNEDGFSLDQIKKFFAIMIVIQLAPQPSYECYWMLNHPFYGSNWIRSKMSKALFLEILHSLSWELDSLFEFVNNLVASIWVPSSDISVDEMMIPFKGSCPHHVFVARKPHPHGMKVWSVADSKKYLYNIRLYKRSTQEYPVPALFSGSLPSYQRVRDVPIESTQETLEKMVATLPAKGRVIFCDSYFGSLSVAESLTQKGFGIVCACRKDRPRWLFKECRDHPHPEAPYFAVTGTFMDRHSFSAYTLCSNAEKEMHLISNIHNAHDFIDVVESQSSTTSEEDFLVDKVSCRIPRARHEYLKFSRFVDQCGMKIIGDFPRSHSCLDYEIVTILWVFRVLLHNARVVFHEFSEKKLEFSKYLELVAKILAPDPQENNSNCEKTHDLVQTNLPNSRCKMCEGNQRRTDKKCSVCAVACCETCFNSISHVHFISKSKK